MGATLVACVAENSERWYQKVQNLVLSLRRFAGDLAGAPFAACFMELDLLGHAKGAGDPPDDRWPARSAPAHEP